MSVGFTAVRVFVTVLVMGLVGCSKGLPADKADYAGEWRSPEMRLVISNT